MAKKHIVNLTDQERETATTLIAEELRTRVASIS